MSVSHPDEMSFGVRDESGEAASLAASYDEKADILYLWTGEAPREAISVTCDEGHLVRLDPVTYEVVGFTIFDFRLRWQAESLAAGELKVSLPSLGEHEGLIARARELELVAS